MNIKIRRLNDLGIEQFRQWLTKPDGNPPQHMLEDDGFTEPLSGNAAIDIARTFETTYALGDYLASTVFSGVEDLAKLRADVCMWAWLSLALIPNLLSKSGKPLDSRHYLEAVGPSSQRWAYRLIARTAWEVVRLHKERAAVALGSKRSPWGEMAEQLCSRQQVFSHRSFWAIAHHLYLGPDGKVVRGATSQRPASARKNPKNTSGRGGVRRLPFTFRQFDRTFSTREMTLEQMVSLLPSEYARWANK
jgi:hypothetical protein